MKTLNLSFRHLPETLATTLHEDELIYCMCWFDESELAVRVNVPAHPNPQVEKVFEYARSHEAKLIVFSWAYDVKGGLPVYTGDVQDLVWEGRLLAEHIQDSIPAFTSDTMRLQEILEELGRRSRS